MQVKSGPATKSLDIRLDVKALKDDGSFEGYGSVFNNLDSYQDIVAPGAFTRSLQEHTSQKSMPKLLWQHDPAQPIGRWTEMNEDKKGLYVKGQLALKTRLGSEIYELLKMDAISGMSIGYMTRKSSYDEETNIRTLVDLDLWEVSLVTFPANPDAQVEAIKSIKTIRDFETFLRDEGRFSRNDAKKIAASGFASLATREVSGGLSEVMAGIRHINQLFKEKS